MKKNDRIPLHEKYVLTIEEACQYFSIGRDKMYELAKEDGCQFVLHNGRSFLIKRVAMEKYLEQTCYI